MTDEFTQTLLGFTQTVERPRLMQRFMEGLSRKLTWIEAPLGYGKTTLMSAWVDQLSDEGINTVYLSFEGLNGSHSQRVANALRRLGVPDEEERPIVPDTRTPSLGSDKPRCLFLDDFHEADLSCQELLQRLLRQKMDGLHLILGSREPPRFALTKLRMADQVTDFSMTDLRFDLTEANALFQNALPDETLAVYLNRAEGWIAALQLLRQFGLKDTDDPPDFDKLSELANYLNEQYFDQLTANQQHLLVHTAHVSRVDGDLADRLSARSDSWIQLSQLAATNALIFEEAGKSTPVYRYHQLLRDFLYQKQRHLGRARREELHRTTSTFFSEVGDLQAAMEHACLAGESEHAAELLLDAGGVQFGMLRGAGRLASCLEALSTSLIFATPRLSVAHAYLLLKQGRLQEAADLLQSIRNGLAANDRILEREIILVEAHARAYQDLAMSQTQLDALEHTVSLTPATDPLARGLLSNFLCMFFIEQGDFSKARTFGESAMMLYTDIGAEHLQFFMHLHLSALDLETRTLKDALQHREQALAISKKTFSDDPTLCAIAKVYHDETAFESGKSFKLAKGLTKALCRIDRGEGWNMLYLAGYETCLSLLMENADYDEAVELCEQAGNLVARRGMQLFSNQLLSMQLELAVRLGALKEAGRLASQTRAMLEKTDPKSALRWRGRIRAELAMARFEAATGVEACAIERVQRTGELCARLRLPRLQLRALVQNFLICAQIGRSDQAETALKACLALVRTHGSFGAVLRDGAGFHTAALWLVGERGLGRFSSDDTHWLAACLWRIKGRREGQAVTILVDLLTDREMAVLDQLEKGFANKVIARELGISEPTVKFHLQNVYRKIGVNSRKLAIEIARQYGPSVGNLHDG